MKKIILMIIIILFCVGCETKEDINNIEFSNKNFNDTIYGHKDGKEAMSIDEAYSLVNNMYGTLYDEIEYYDMVKFAPVDVLNDFYAFYVTFDNDSYYLLVDIYNGVTTFVTAADLNIEE